MPAMTLETGQRVRFKAGTWKVITNYEIDLSGKTGTVQLVEQQRDAGCWTIDVLMDEVIADLAEWDNLATWYDQEPGDETSRLLECVDVISTGVQ